MSNFHLLWMQSGTEYLEKGEKVIEIARQLSMTERERDYIDAIGAFYDDWEKADRGVRLAAFEQRMSNNYRKYKDDKEAAIFYALTLIATAKPADKTYSNQLKAGGILETVFADQPNHPGVAHYIIHTYDYPELAEKALPVARRYASIAPASAHAQHMPSHIFTRLGLWDESILSNIQSTQSASCYAQQLGKTGHWDEELHGMDYLVYAYLQKGDNLHAIEQLERLKSFKEVFPQNFKVAYTAAAIPARIALENKDWKSAASLELPLLELDWDEFPWQKSILHFARAMGGIQIGDLESAGRELSELESLHQKLVAAQNEYMANQVEIQIVTTKAWLLKAEGNDSDAISTMIIAADLESNTVKHPVTPGEVRPAGELLGDLYMESGNPEKALECYQKDLQIHPNRFNGIYGAAKASIEIGDQEQATYYFRRLLELTKGNTERLEVEAANTYLNKIG